MKKQIVISIAITFCIFTKAKSQVAPSIHWQNTMGGTNDDMLYSLAPTADGGYICGGWSISGIGGDKTENNTLGDYWIVKLDSAGNIMWQNTIGGADGDELKSVSQTTDGGYICGGTSASNISGDKTENSQGSTDYWIIKLDASGNIQWQNTIGGNAADILASVIQTKDGGYLVGGSSYSDLSGDKTEANTGFSWTSDFWIVKLNAAGNIQWQNTVGGSDHDELYTITQAADGGYFCGGWSQSNSSGDKTENSLGFDDCWLVKLDSSGVLQWDNTMGGSDGDELVSVVPSQDNGCVFAAVSWSNISADKTENSMGFGDYWIVGLDSSGNIKWQNTIGGAGIDAPYSIAATADGGYVCGGKSDSNSSGDKTENSRGFEDYWIIKLDGSANIQWQKTIGGNENDVLRCIYQTGDKGYICAGYSQSPFSGEKTEVNWDPTLLTNDYWIVKLYDDTTTGIHKNNFDNAEIHIYPSPASAYLNVELPFKNKSGENCTLYLLDVMGNQVLYMNVYTAHIKVSTENISKGIYFLKIVNGTNSYLKKIVISKL